MRSILEGHDGGVEGFVPSMRTFLKLGQLKDTMSSGNTHCDGAMIARIGVEEIGRFGWLMEGFLRLARDR